MADIRIDSPEFFTEESYQEYLRQTNPVRNERLREKDESIFDALISPEADFRNAPYGDKIVAAIQGYNK